MSSASAWRPDLHYLDLENATSLCLLSDRLARDGLGLLQSTGNAPGELSSFAMPLKSNR